MRVDVEEIISIHKRIQQINEQPLEQIEWYKKGEKIEVDKKQIDEWKFIGLSNFYFLSLMTKDNFYG